MKITKKIKAFVLVLCMLASGAFIEALAANPLVNQNKLLIDNMYTDKNDNGNSGNNNNSNKG